jgi:tRNA nucleotidyltransferase/poly(A) polymerase
MRSFKDFIQSKSIVEQSENKDKKDWKKQFVKLEKGFIPPSNMKPIVQAFLNSNSISIMNDTSKELTMPKKNLYLTGGSVRDFLKNKTPKNFNLVTNATPEQTARILNDFGFRSEQEDYDFGFESEAATEGDDKTWYVSDSDSNGRPLAITAVVRGDKFEISTFLKGSEYTDDIEEDAKRRDISINSLYIELTKPDGENNKLYDPTKHGWYDITQGNINVLGNPEKRFEEDPLRMMRVIRFHSQYGKGEISKEITKAIKELRSDISAISSEKAKKEFIKGLVHPDIDPKFYLQNYSKTNIINQLFPNVNLNLDVPSNFSNKKDKSLALAWILQDNSIEEVEKVLSSKNDREENTGWTDQERNTVVFLLRIKEFDVDNLDDLLDQKKYSGLSPDQIMNWVSMFEVDGKNSRPKWAKLIKSFCRFTPDYSKLYKPNDESNINVIKYINKERLKNMFGDFSKY